MGLGRADQFQDRRGGVAPDDDRLYPFIHNQRPEKGTAAHPFTRTGDQQPLRGRILANGLLLAADNCLRVGINRDSVLPGNENIANKDTVVAQRTADVGRNILHQPLRLGGEGAVDSRQQQGGQQGDK